MACRRYRNRRIGEYLKELGLTEGRNTGVHKMLRALRENGSPEPLFETDEDRLYFITTIYAREGARAVAGAKPPTRAERRSAVLAYLRDNPSSSIAMVHEALGIPTATLNRDIAALRDGGVLQRMGRNGDWVVP